MKNILFLILFIALTSCSSLRGSEDEVRRYLLTVTPLGMPLTELVEIAKRKEWRIHVVDNGLGIKYRNGNRKYESYRPDTIIGIRSVNGYLGHYQGLPLRVDVVAYWAIGENNEIIDLVVNKQYDGL